MSAATDSGVPAVGSAARSPGAQSVRASSLTARWADEARSCSISARRLRRMRRTSASGNTGSASAWVTRSAAVCEVALRDVDVDEQAAVGDPGTERHAVALHQLGELLGLVARGALVEQPGRHRGDALETGRLGRERERDDDPHRQDVLAGDVVGQDAHAVAEHVLLGDGERPGSGGGDVGARDDGGAHATASASVEASAGSVGVVARVVLGEVGDDRAALGAQPAAGRRDDVVAGQRGEAVEVGVDDLGVVVEQVVVADDVGPLLLAGQGRQPGALGLGERGLELGVGGPVLEEAGELLEEGVLDVAGVDAGGDVEDDEAERAAVDEAPRRGVRAEGGLLAAHEAAHEPRGRQAADAVEGHGRREELVGAVDRQAEGDVEAVVGHGRRGGRGAPGPASGSSCGCAGRGGSALAGSGPR